MFSPTLFDAALLLFGVFVVYKFSRSTGKLSLPPGPKGYPIIGNVLDMPKEFAWETFAKWGEIYGGILSMNLLGQTFVILNDPQLAIEILEKKGNIYADRPNLPMATLCGWDRVLGSARHGSLFREYRKLIGRVIGTRGRMARFHGIEESEAIMFLRRILTKPSALDEATRKSAAAMVLHITYGYKIKEDGIDPLVDLADRALTEFSEVTKPGAFLVDLLPILRFVPSWFPGAGFKQLATKYGKTCDALGDVPMAYVQEQMAQGSEKPSYVADLLKDKDVSEQRLYEIKWSAASFYGAGADTTVSVFYQYFLATALHPEVQRKAQAEIDAVVGKDRLPTYSDRENLPYIEAVCRELYRWLPIVPLAVPHRAMADDVHEGYLIPQGTLVIANVWKFLHDSDIYKDPFKFNPDRFMGPNPERNPQDFCFGFGRRICPGNHLADASVWILVAKAAAALDVTKAIDDKGNIIEPRAEVTDGVISRPVISQFGIKPRSEHVVELIWKAEV